jgi:hypothetical protein
VDVSISGVQDLEFRQEFPKSINQDILLLQSKINIKIKS